MSNYVGKLTVEETLTLEEMHKKHPCHLSRKRAHAILLSHQGYSIPSICDIYGVCRQTVTIWFFRWNKQGVCGLFDRPGRGRPQKLSVEKIDDTIEKIKISPRSLKKILADLTHELNISISIDTLKQSAFAKKRGLSGNASENHCAQSVIKTPLMRHMKK